MILTHRPLFFAGVIAAITFAMPMFGADTPPATTPMTNAATPPPPPPPPVPPTGKSYAPKLIYHFDPSIFDTPKFPGGSFEQDALVRAYFSPVQVTTTFYNAQFKEVQQADTPGRYGAVVSIKLGDGTECKRFLTIYRTPEKFSWRHTHFDSSIQFPSELGVDSAVVHQQQSEIGKAVESILQNDSNRRAYLAVVLAGLSELKPGTPAEVMRNNAGARDDLWWWEMKKRIGLAGSYAYQVQLPDGYDTQPDKHWPLILFLHGSGERGDNLAKLNSNGIPKLIAAGKKFPAIVISPQCPENDWWKVPELSQLLDDVSAKYRVDADRVSLTGLSMGGYGSWALALAYPDRFSAIVPICGGSDPLDAARLRHLPIWAFHGEKDPTVPVEMTKDMIAAVRKAGGHPHLTLYPDAGHNSWAQAYDTEALYTWLLAQKKGQPEVTVPGVP